ncbi:MULTISPECIES: hypothetical protein [unclassified Leucobacter]|uniref:hypothetical protein n=1 Tax=unclassified Leucobacter TaxID=2621730 RepID=UPI0006214BBB|nr:hypothetical protein [Leucobacter sp. Ag1]KKI20545.1 hypothetical protein XM48_07420 [Leucobacter sp. Ag1]
MKDLPTEAVVYNRAEWIRDRRARRALRCRYRVEVRRWVLSQSTGWAREGVHRLRCVAIAHAWWLDFWCDGIRAARVVDQQHPATNSTTPASAALAAEEGTDHDR